MKKLEMRFLIMKNNYRIEYDFIRIISALIVVCYHYSVILTNMGYMGFCNFFCRIGNIALPKIAVYIFFMLSGATLWIGNTNVSLKQFYLKRAKSIYPLFWCCYFPLLVLKLFIDKSFFIGKNPILFILSVLGIDGYFSYLHPNFYIIGEWFLGGIIILYLLFPVISFCMKKNQFIVLSASFVLFLFTIFFNLWEIDISRNLIVILLFFILGIFFENNHVVIEENRVKCLIFSISLFFLSVFLQANTLIVIFLQTVSSFIIFYLFFNYLKSFLLGKIYSVIQSLGSITYIIFLIHHVILKFLTHKLISIIGNSFVVCTLLLILIILCSYLIKFFFNKISMLSIRSIKSAR